MIEPVERVVIAHRGASGYLPEHTLEAKAMAYGMGADYVEQDCVLTKDGHVVVLHDVHLDTVTDVAKKFPLKAHKDGRFLAIDFTLAEIKTLNVNERIDIKTGKRVFPGRFPAGKGDFKVPTLAEEIELVQGLNRSTGRNVGIYPEIKKPAWHRQRGHDLSVAVLKVLTQYGYTQHKDRVYVQCFDQEETRRLRTELKCQLKLIQLVSETVTAQQMKAIAEYADGIGPKHDLLVTAPKSTSKPVANSFVSDAHANKLKVHAWTLRNDSLPKYATDLDQLTRFMFVEAGVDGVFTDFPDKAVSFRDRMDQ